MTIKELDRIKTKDGRIGTIMLVLHDSNNNIGFDVEFDDTAPEIETIDLEDVSKVIVEN